MDINFLLLSLFFPRITLFSYWYWWQIPFNTIPFVWDAVLGVIVPRILILIYIAENLGVNNHWFIIHLIVLIISCFGTTKACSK